MQSRAARTGYVPGAWDMFHIGHLNLLLRAREHCERLIVGVVTDEALEQMKGRRPVIPHAERLEIVRHIDCIDEAITDTAIDKRVVWREHRFDRLFKGDDWQGTAKGQRLEADMAAVGVEVVYFPYTLHTSSTQLRARLVS